MQQPKIFKTKPKLPKGVVVLEVMESALTELFFIEHPHIPKGAHDPAVLRTYIRAAPHAGVWVYYPWRALCMHMPSEQVYVRLRTARNRNLIRPDEQEKYRAARVGIAGLSVGSAALSSLVLTGGPKYIKLADPDIVEITNLNRMRATVLDVGRSKVEVAARAAWELDPYVQIETWEKGITHESLKKFVSAPRLDVFVDEMDAIQLKFACREICKKLRIPVVMATDNGDSIILDVERFDLEPKRPNFHGRVHVSAQELQSMTREKFIALSNAIIDPTYFTVRQQESLMEIGRTLSGVAQLGSAATLAGVAVAYAVRRITTGQSMPSGRYTLGCEDSFIVGYSASAEKKKRAAHTKKFNTFFNRA